MSRIPSVEEWLAEIVRGCIMAYVLPKSWKRPVTLAWVLGEVESCGFGGERLMRVLEEIAPNADGTRLEDLREALLYRGLVPA